MCGFLALGIPTCKSPPSQACSPVILPGQGTGPFLGAPSGTLSTGRAALLTTIYLGQDERAEDGSRWRPVKGAPSLHSGPCGLSTSSRSWRRSGARLSTQSAPANGGQGSDFSKSELHSTKAVPTPQVLVYIRLFGLRPSSGRISPRSPWSGEAFWCLPYYLRHPKRDGNVHANR